MPDRSALLPVETNEDRPRPRRAASAIAAIPNAPLCEAKRDPAGGRRHRREGRVRARRRRRVEHAEAVRADEPHARRRGRRRAARPGGAAPRGADLGEAGREHDERAHAGGAALARDRRRRPSAGTATTASSTGPGTSAIERWAVRPPNAAAARVHDGQRAAKPAARRLSSTAAPTEPGAREAPITATDAGRSTCADGRRRGDAVAVLEARARRRRRARPATRRAARPAPTRTSTAKPESRKTWTIRWFAGSTAAVKRRDAVARCASSARCASRTVAMPWPCQSSATSNATSARSRRLADVARVRRRSALGRPPPRRARGPVGARARRSTRRPDVMFAPPREEPQPARLGREAVEERAQALLVLGAHGAHAHRSAVAERDVDGLGREKGHQGVMATLATPSRWLAKRS